MSQPASELPNSIEAEQAVLGAIIRNNDAMQRVADILERDHFYDALHAQIFDLMQTLINAGKLANPVTMKPFLPADLKIGNKSAHQYLTLLVSESVGGPIVRSYAETIRELADRRSLMMIGETLQTQQADSEKIAGWAIDELDHIVAARTQTGAPTVDMGEAMARAVDAVAQAYQNDGKIIGVPTGLPDLDHMTLGMHPGDLVILAGRPGMGKTALALSIVRNMSREGHPGIFFSLEMPDVQLSLRMLADELYQYAPARGSSLSYWRLRSGKVDTSEFDRIVEAARRIEKWPVIIEQKPQPTLAFIGARARQAKRKGKLKYLVIDHLGLVRASKRYAGNMVAEIGEITGGLKALAKDLGIPVIVLCQLGRAIESRENKRPVLGDLRDSGHIEQDADTVIMLYREHYYLKSREPRPGSDEHLKWQIDMEACFNKLEVGIEKQRSGPTGRIELFVDMGCNAVRDQSFSLSVIGGESLPFDAAPQQPLLV